MKVSSLATGFAGISIAQIADFVSWGLNGFPAGKYPTDAPMLIAVALAMLVHALYNRFTIPKVPNETQGSRTEDQGAGTQGQGAGS